MAVGIGLAVGSVGWGIATAVRSSSSGDPSPSQPTSTVAADVLEARRSLEVYEEEVERIAKGAGRVVQLGLKAGIGELDRGEEPGADEFAERAEGWERELRGYRSELAALDPPSFLADTELRRLDAMDGYIEVARILARAAGVTGDERSALLDEAVETGETADDVWEEADSAVNRHRERLGLPVTTLPGDIIDLDDRS